jgi:hypothetical protein
MFCGRCRTEKEESEFYPSQKRSWCKECMKEYARNLKRKNPEVAKKWRDDSPRRYYIRHKDEFSRKSKEWRASHKEAKRAHGRVFKAIHRGEIERPSKCDECGVPCKPQATHPGHDYSKPFEIRFLCVRCHQKQDNKKLGYGAAS